MPGESIAGGYPVGFVGVTAHGCQGGIHAYTYTPKAPKSQVTTHPPIYMLTQPQETHTTGSAYPAGPGTGR